ncbi:MAG: ligase-associated DNA damage response endonuclease PdeM [Cyclobacteriaceae bacterium]|nr:ligase-associated DNA damage response endonuclease PdeM [Cyclobacteriaceae bacterium]
MGFKINILNEVLELFPQKVIMWHSKRMLVVADVHLGKINHFRKNGIPVPARAGRQNIEALVSILDFLQPRRVLFLGDLFHSRFNSDWEAVLQVIRHYESVSFELVEGNHDVLEKVHYEQSGLKLHGAYLEESPFLFTHQPMEAVPEGKFNIAGHLHPGLFLQGKGKQGIKLPCFHFSAQRAVCPAFGGFTGLSSVRPMNGDRLFVIADSEVVEVSAK